MPRLLSPNTARDIIIPSVTLLVSYYDPYLFTTINEVSECLEVVRTELLMIPQHEAGYKLRLARDLFSMLHSTAV